MARPTAAVVALGCSVSRAMTRRSMMTMTLIIYTAVRPSNQWETSPCVAGLWVDRFDVRSAAEADRLWRPRAAARASEKVQARRESRSFVGAACATFHTSPCRARTYPTSLCHSVLLWQLGEGTTAFSSSVGYSSEKNKLNECQWWAVVTLYECQMSC